MPELPEVETTKEGIKPHLEGQTINTIIVRNSRFRLPVPANINELCEGKTVKAVLRRAKYILIHLSHGTILIHLGMSGHLRIVPVNTKAEKHDHIDLVMKNGSTLRFCDPRRFGLFTYIEDNPNQHSLFTHLGPEPLSDDFNSNYLFKSMTKKTQSIKSLIMNNNIVVGVGNIYATESLFFTGIHPSTPAQHLTADLCNELTHQIKRILQQAITSGGTTLRDFYSFDGKPGYFSLSLQVYGRKNQPCFRCNTLVDALIIGGRTSAFCPKCQPFLAS